MTDDPRPPRRRVRDLDGPRGRLHAVKDQMDAVRNAPWRPLQFRMAAVLAGTLPLGVACALIRLAATHDGIGFALALAIGGTLSGAAMIGCAHVHPDDAGLAAFFRAEVIALYVVVLVASLYFLPR